jgi:hypothetical protein
LCVRFAADLLADKRAEMTDSATATARVLQRPQNAAIAAVGMTTTLCLLARPHETFQFLGLTGLELTLLAKCLAYDSPQEAVSDVEGTLNSLFGGVSRGATQLGDAASSAGTSSAVEMAEQQAAPAQAEEREVPPVVIDEQPASPKKKKSNGKPRNGNGANGKVLTVIGGDEKSVENASAPGAN